MKTCHYSSILQWLAYPCRQLIARQLLVVLAIARLSSTASGQTFAPTIILPVGKGTNPRSVAVADMNGDKNPDIILANGGSESIGVLLGNGEVVQLGERV